MALINKTALLLKTQVRPITKITQKKINWMNWSDTEIIQQKNAKMIYTDMANKIITIL